MRGLNRQYGTKGRNAAGKAVFRGTAFLFRAVAAVVSGTVLAGGVGGGCRLGAQTVDPYAHITPVEVTESRNDSAILANHLIVDLTMENLLYMLSEYENFDYINIHYPKTDFTRKHDTTFLNLLPGFGQRYVHPFMGRVTSRFGPRGGRYHLGTDVKLFTGDSVRSAFDGVIRIARRSRSYGYVIVVRHYNGLETYYAHLSKLLVKKEQVVQAGEVIGLGGNTGRSYGAHLHFEVRYLGTALDPEILIDFTNGRLKMLQLPICKETFAYQIEQKQARWHTVRSGETLSSIARRYGTTVGNIQRLNKLGGTTIRAGSTLRVR